MRKSTKQIIAGMLAATMTMSLSVSTVTTYAATSVQEHEITTANVFADRTPLENNQLVIDLLNTTSTEPYTKWNDPEQEMTESHWQIVRNVVNEIVKDKTTDLQKVEAIFKWIGQNIKYDYGNADYGQAKLHPVEILEHKYAVCGGYSNLYKAMLNAIHIPSVIVYGITDSGAHQWNLVYAGGEWFYSDSTWGTSMPNKFTYKMDLKSISSSHNALNMANVSFEGENGCMIGFVQGKVSVLETNHNQKELNPPATYKGFPVERISLGAFHDQLTTIRVGEQIQEIDVKGAPKAQNLQSIVVDPNNKVYTSVEGVLCSKDKNIIYIYPNGKTDVTFTIPKETKEFDNKETFTAPALKDVLVEAGNEHFSSYKGTVFNKAQTSIVFVPEGKEIVAIPGTARLDDIALNSKQAIKEVVLEEGIKTIPAYTFNNCRNLTKLTIPESVTEIQPYAFGQTPGQPGEAVPTHMTFYGKKGSYAELYAKERNIPFVDTTPQPEPQPQPQPDPEPQPEPQPEPAVFPYVDVKQGDWYYECVDYAFQNKLMTGLETTIFGPVETLARAQFAVILHRMNNKPTVEIANPFPDVPQTGWFTDAVLWANSIDVIKGYSHNNHFGPGDQITREQMAVMMYRYAIYKKIDTNEKVDFAKFEDASRVSAFAKEAMSWAIGTGIITGKYNGTQIDPQGNASRAECAMIIMRFVQKYEEFLKREL